MQNFLIAGLLALILCGVVALVNFLGMVWIDLVTSWLGFNALSFGIAIVLPIFLIVFALIYYVIHEETKK